MRLALKILRRTLIVLGLALAVILALFVFWVPGLVEDELQSVLSGLGLPGTTVSVVAITPDGARLADLDLGGDGRLTIGTVDVEFDIGRLLDGRIDRVAVTGARFEARLTEDGLDLGPLDRLDTGEKSDPAAELPFGRVDIRRSLLVVARGADRMSFPVDGTIENLGGGRLKVELTTEIAGETVRTSAEYRTWDGSATARIRATSGEADIGFSPAEEKLTAKVRVRRERIEVRLPAGRVEAEGVDFAADLTVRGMETFEAAEVRINAARVAYGGHEISEIVFTVAGGGDSGLDFLAFAKYRGLDLDLSGSTPADISLLGSPEVEFPVSFRVEGALDAFVDRSLASGHAELGGDAVVSRADGRPRVVLGSFRVDADLDLPRPVPIRTVVRMSGAGSADEAGAELRIEQMTAGAWRTAARREAPDIEADLPGGATISVVLGSPIDWTVRAPAVRARVRGLDEIELPGGITIEGVSGELGLSLEGGRDEVRVDLLESGLKVEQVRLGGTRVRELSLVPHLSATLRLEGPGAGDIGFDLREGVGLGADAVYLGEREEVREIDGLILGAGRLAGGRLFFEIAEGSAVRAGSFFGAGATTASEIALIPTVQWDGAAGSGTGRVAFFATRIESPDTGAIAGFAVSADVEATGPLDRISAAVLPGSTAGFDSYLGADGTTAGRMAFAIEGRWYGDRKGFEGKVKSTLPIDVKRAPFEAEVAELSLSAFGSLAVPGSPDVLAVVTLGVPRLRDAEQDLTVKGLHLAVPVAVGEQFRGAPGKGHLRVGKIEVQKRSFPGPEIAIDYVDGRYSVEGTWAPVTEAAITLSGSYEPSLRGGSGEIRIGGPAFAIRSDGPIGGLVKDLSKTSLTGKLAVTGRIDIRRDRVRPEIRVLFTDGLVTSAEDTQRFEGVWADVTVLDFDPPRTAGGQRVSWTGGKLGEFEVGAGGLRFTVETPRSILVERAVFSLGEAGQAYAHSFRIDPDAPEISADIFVENLSLELWLDLVTEGDVRGEGLLHGRIPIRIATQPQMQIALGEGGYLYAEGGGTIGVPDTEMVEGILKDNLPSIEGDTDYTGIVRDRMVQALRQFKFETLKFLMIGNKRNQTLRVVMIGEGLEAPHQGLNMTVNVNGVDAALRESLKYKLGFEKRTTRLE